MKKHLILPLMFCWTMVWGQNAAPAGPWAGDSITVYVFLLEDCVICQNYSLTLRRLHETFASPKIQFVGLFPNRFSESEKVAEYKAKYKIPFDLKLDHFKTRTKKMGATITPSVAVYDHTKDEILYRGRIDNMYYRLGKKRTLVTTAELEQALRAITQGTPISVKETDAVGCFINFNY